MSASSTNRKVKADLYREAARLLESDLERSPYSCDAIGAACGWFPHNRGSLEAFRKLTDDYRALFSPRKHSKSDYWWPDTYASDAKDRRILALCFMAAMVEAGDA